MSKYVESDSSSEEGEPPCKNLSPMYAAYWEEKKAKKVKGSSMIASLFTRAGVSHSVTLITVLGATVIFKGEG